MTEIPQPLAVRRKVAFSEAAYEGEMVVEDARASLAGDHSRVKKLWYAGSIAVIVDPEGAIIPSVSPDVLIDATMTKREKGAMKGQAPLVIGVGPGFSAPDRVDAVVESNRGQDLGRVIYRGETKPLTGVPGVIAGYSKERVPRSPHAGIVRPVKTIGAKIQKDEVALFVDETPVAAQIAGVVRGLIGPIHVTADEKVGVIDPRADGVPYRRTSPERR